MPEVNDYDIHGIVGIRLLDAGPAEVGAVSRQLGPVDGRLRREPDITIRFVDRIPLRNRLCLLGHDDAAFTRDAFFCLRAQGKSRATVQIPFAGIGNRCELVCERGMSAVPLLVPIVNLTALARGALPLHAAAFVYEGTGILTTGWSKGGKTESLLAFMAHGARYVGDEWVYVTAEGERMAGLPEPIHVRDWHLRSLPVFRSALSRVERARLGAVRWMGHALSGIFPNGTPKPASIRRLAHAVSRQAFVHVEPHRLFGGERCAMSGGIDKVFLVASHDSETVRIERVEAEEIARRMAFSLQEEQSRLTSYYRKFRFAFPHLRNPLLEESALRQRELLSRALRGKESFAVYHPDPVCLETLYERMRPYCGRRKS